MSSARGRLQLAVADAISAQLADEVDESVLPRDVAVRLTAERLVQEALSLGHAGDAELADVHGFTAGNTALMVARVNARMSYVVKVDTSPALVHEAHLLQRIAIDPTLPASTRAAFPRVFAIDDIGPIYGYLMEDLEDYLPLQKSLAQAQPDTGDLISALWEVVLAPAYRASQRSRLAHELWDDYFGRALQRLRAAASAGALPAEDATLVIRTDTEELILDEGWGAEIEACRDLLHAVRPTFGTWVHGDPNPENALWREGPEGPTFKLLDPKDWWTGDYLFDAAKLGHYIVVTGPIESGTANGAAAIVDGEISVDEEAFRSGRPVEERLLAGVARLAAVLGDDFWRPRYDLAFAANLLSIAGPRAQRAAERNEQVQQQLALAALGLGLLNVRRAREQATDLDVGGSSGSR